MAILRDIELHEKKASEALTKISESKSPEEIMRLVMRAQYHIDCAILLTDRHKRNQKQQIKEAITYETESVGA